MADEKEVVDTTLTKATNPLVFISHDTRDAELAEAFSNLLKSVSAGVLKSFRTSDRRGNQGIEYGIEWYPEIIRNIQSASDVVCLLTERSVNRPWILFEAGMAKGKFDTPILGVALGIELKTASTGPFAQFQNCADDDESLT
ncbi:MAG: toll/interleukin-1 receptor domain-containing protein, partial [Burkholderiales bacterium]|nr:toll/interleukin-1 receptor domain-containing protein [Burkholderiales bacterium]